MKRKLILFAVMSVFALGLTAQINGTQLKETDNKNAEATQAEIKFDTLKIDLGTFSEREPIQTCTFTFTNIGNAPLILNQAFASCGCTVPTYTKEPVMPGEKGKIDVTYNGKGKFTGHISKTITVRSNAKNELVRLTIEGNMTK